MCALALIENVNNETFSIQWLVEFFNGHEEMDRHYRWGMQLASWTQGVGRGTINGLV